MDYYVIVWFFLCCYRYILSGFVLKVSIEKSNTMTGKSVGLDFRFALQYATGNH
jgi:hypothetical protein